MREGGPSRREHGRNEGSTEQRPIRCAAGRTESLGAVRQLLDGVPGPEELRLALAVRLEDAPLGRPPQPGAAGGRDDHHVLPLEP